MVCWHISIYIEKLILPNFDEYIVENALDFILEYVLFVIVHYGFIYFKLSLQEELNIKPPGLKKIIMDGNHHEFAISPSGIHLVRIKLSPVMGASIRLLGQLVGRLDECFVRLNEGCKLIILHSWGRICSKNENDEKYDHPTGRDVLYLHFKWKL